MYLTKFLILLHEVKSKIGTHRDTIGIRFQTLTHLV